MCGKDGGRLRKENQRRDNIFCVKWGDWSKGTNGHWVTEEEGKREQEGRWAQREAERDRGRRGTQQGGHPALRKPLAHTRRPAPTAVRAPPVSPPPQACSMSSTLYKPLSLPCTAQPSPQSPAHRLHHVPHNIRQFNAE